MNLMCDQVVMLIFDPDFIKRDPVQPAMCNNEIHHSCRRKGQSPILLSWLLHNKLASVRGRWLAGQIGKKVSTLPHDIIFQGLQKGHGVRWGDCGEQSLNMTG